MCQFEVTTNVNKQITGLKGISLDKTTYRDYSAVHTLDTHGHYVELEDTDANGLFYRMELDDFAATIKTYHRFLKDWPVNVMNYWYEYRLTTPVNGNGVFLKRTYYSGYDATGTFVGLTKRYEILPTYQTNSSQYATQMTTTHSGSHRATPD